MPETPGDAMAERIFAGENRPEVLWCVAAGLRRPLARPEAKPLAIAWPPLRVMLFGVSDPSMFQWLGLEAEAPGLGAVDTENRLELVLMMIKEA